MRIYLFVIIVSFQLVLGDNSTNNRPIIAILSQEYFPSPSHSYIAASYVKYLESAGARIVPILLNQNDEYYENIVNYTNGLLFPGGGQYLNNSLYRKFGERLWNLALEKNKIRYYPIWGTCLGFELLTILQAGEDVLTKCDSRNVAMNLNFAKGILDNKDSTRLFRNADSKIIDILKSKKVTFNYHKQCLTEKIFNSNSYLKENFTMITTNQDATNSNLTFVSTMEHKHLPIYGVQWHPEKNQYEFVLNDNYRHIPHDYDAILIGEYFANFFVNEARKSCSVFPNILKESQHLIYNYYPTYTGMKTNATYEQIYIFSISPHNKPWCVTMYLIVFLLLLFCYL